MRHDSLCSHCLTFLSQALWVYIRIQIFIIEAELIHWNDSDRNTFLWLLHEVRSFTGYWLTALIWAPPGDIIKTLPMKLNHRLGRNEFHNSNPTHLSQLYPKSILTPQKSWTTRNCVHPDTMQEETHSLTPEGFLPKAKFNQSVIKSPDLTAYLQEIREIEEQIKWHNQKTIS